MRLLCTPRSFARMTQEDINSLIAEIERYLEVVDFFRSLGCDPTGR
jgi:hypothetical protein